MQTVISFQNVSKYFFLQHQRTLKEALQALLLGEKPLEKVEALKNVSFEIKKGETVGIIGRNGAGKSTLLKLIAGVSKPTKGRLKINGQVSPLIELGAGFHPELTGRENIILNAVILGLSRKQAKERFEEVVEFSELDRKFLDIPLKHYSSGMYMRLAFSVAVSVDPEILLVDEILAVGDMAFQAKCKAKMEEFKRKGVTILYVSHNIEEVERFCERVIYLKEGRVVFDGKVKEGVERYRRDIDL